MAVRQILLVLSEDDFGGAIPTNGRFTAVASATRVSGEDVTLPNFLTRDIVAGDFESEVELEVNGDPFGWYWTITIRDDEDTVMLRRYVIVPTGIDPIALGDLPIVDPGTETASAEPEAAWWIALEQRPIIIRLTQEEYDALTPEQQADPHIFWVIPSPVAP